MYTMFILNNIRLDIQQKTPVRVLHRRTVMTRPRTVTDIQAELVDEHHFKIAMTTQAGTYVRRDSLLSIHTLLFT